MTPDEHRQQAETLLSRLWPTADIAIPPTPEQRADMLHAAQIHAAIYAADVQREMAAGVHGALNLAATEQAAGQPTA
ncbi:hypothetical protein TPA0907_55670 [Micromonospora humidisoli]|uniref:hypothetical protein n=1 Tax=Micromonospora TaxID=1873 RepID=UPI0022C704CF|nr:hypothetical protein [Micromonospora sp. AKA109]GHJ11200.1 hypothetical protein TPA0907_55670 [Micromonospora sp. AKA109]